MKKSLFGYGGTIKSIAKSGGWDIYDDKFSEISRDEFGNTLLPVSEFKPELSELEITTPGISPSHELIKKARNLISEYDYFATFSGLKIWISGTNGKTTTTKMTQHLLERHGSQMGGNVGVPLGELDKNAEIWVLETSSFTIHYTNLAIPDIYVLLPITPDHLTWHGNFSEYERAKLKPLEKMSEGSVAIVPKIYAETPTKAHVIGYENEVDLAKFCSVNLSDIAFKTPFLTDALMALCVEKILFDSCDIALLNGFVIEGNKLEEFSDKFGRIWVNDTKATNIDAAIQAIRRYDGAFLHLILGGDDKGVDMGPLFRELRGAKVRIYAIGSNTDRLMRLANEFKIDALKCEFLQVAVKKIDENFAKLCGICSENILNTGENKKSNENSQAQKTADNMREIALLSPACASLDQFKSYAERGDKFKEFVKNLKS